MARVRCVMMQRDETLLLEAWLRYYGYLFGFENLTVFDNGSTDRTVVETLRRAQHAGVDVRWTHKDHRDFMAKGAHAANVMKHWEELGLDYDFAIPLDCDEFLALFTQTGLECRRSVIHAALDALIGERRALEIEGCLYNAPGRPGWFWSDPYRKRFLPAHAAGEIDHGFHNMTSRHEDGARSTTFTYLHFHNKPFHMTKASARRKLEAKIDVDDLEALRAYQGPGAHLTPYFFMDETAFRTRYDDRTLLGFQTFGELLATLGIASEFLGAPARAWRRAPPDCVAFMRPAEARAPVWFDGAAYLRDNPDVAAAGFPAALHYARYGGAEKRPAPEADLTEAA